MNHFIIFNIVKKVNFLYWFFLDFVMPKFLLKELTFSYLSFSLYSVCLIFLTIALQYLLISKKIYIDDLTGLANEKAFKRDFSSLISSAKRNKATLSLILIDIDNFKQLNTLYGQQTADKILKEVGFILKSDNRASDYTFRQHNRGDEFIIVATETNLDNAKKAIIRKKGLIKKGNFRDITNNLPISITVSCGITQLDLSNDNEESVLARVDEAMRNAKQHDTKDAIVYL